MLWSELINVWVVFTLNVLTPGPNVLNTMATSISRGRAHGLAAALAVGLGNLWWAALALIGAAALFNAWPASERLLSGLGGGLLLWFGWRYLRRARALYVDAAAQSLGAALRGGLFSAFAQALAIQISNPKALTTWLVLVSLLPRATAAQSDLALFAAGSATIALVGHICYALIFSTPAAVQVYARSAWAILAGVGVFFLGLGASLLKAAAGF